MAACCNLKSLYLCLCVILVVNASKLNVPRVLLPFKTSLSTNYTLEVTDGGCYRWTTSRPEVATVTPILGDDVESDCSSKAVVSAVSTEPTRQSTIILATDEGSDTALKCDVIIDAIHSLEIVTTTRELFLDDAPEAFEVHAKNDQEDTFTSIEGLSFDWQLQSKGSSINTVLRFLTFEASPYEAPPSVDYWEKLGMKGHISLVEGIGTGAAAVNVKLIDPKFKDVNQVSVTLIVVANLMLNPAHDVYLLRNCHVQYKVELIKQGRAHEIKMPSDQYYLEVKNSDIVHLDSSSSDVTGLVIGTTTILLNDKNTTNIGAFRQPSAGIHVVTPHHIGFDVKPGSNWILQTPNRYEVTVRIFTLDTREIYPSNNIRMRVTFPEKYFRVEYSSKNGTFHVVHTKAAGRAKLNAKLMAIVKSDGTEVEVEEVENDQLVEIYDKISIQPKLLAYPWDSISKQSYSGKLNVFGGSGSYNWKSSDPSIVQIKKDGTFSTLKAGTAQITAYDSNNKLHFDTAEIAVLEVVGMDILPSPVETMVDSQLFIPLAFYGYQDKEKKEKVPFEDCAKLKIGMEFVDRRFFVYEKDVATAPYPGACRTLTFTAKYQGYSRIFVTYGADLKTTTVIAAFKNLQPFHPPSVAVLALGTSREIAFEGGPRAWVQKEDSHYTELNIAKKSAVDSVLIKDPYRHNVDLHVFRVYCRQIFETEMTLKVGNEPSPTNPMPASQDVMLRTACIIPKKVTLKIITKECKSKNTMCPVSQDVIKIPLQNYEDLQIETRVIDSSGRKVHNVSSLQFEWSVSDPHIGKLSDDNDVMTEVNGAKGFKKPIRHYQDFHPRGHQGVVKISVKITGYKKHFLEELGITEAKAFKPIGASIDLELVEKLEVDSEKISVFNHPQNKVLIKILNGSGHFLVEQTDMHLAEIKYNEDLSAVEVVPKKNGMLSVSIYDMCACMQVSCQIKISGIHTIEVQMSNKVELSKVIEAKVNILDEEGNVLSVSLFSLINLEPVLGSRIISIKPPSINEHGAIFLINGDILGQTTLQFHATSNDKVVSSRQLPLQVFPPFKLYPKNLTLLIGAVFQVESIGGPEPQLNIEFNIKDKDVASVSNAGIIKASSIGSTRVVGNVICGDSTDSTVYSQDEVLIHVVPFNGIKLHIPLTRIKKNSEISIYIVGLNEQENPFSFGTADNPLDVEWIISNSDIATLLPTYHKVPIISKRRNNFAMRLVTKAQGQVTVRVEVRYNGRIFSDEIQLHVFEDLRTKVTNHHGLSILMTPHTETFIKTNRDSIAKMSYKIFAEPVLGLVSVDPQTGKLVSSDKTGEVIVQVTATESFGIIQKTAVIVKVKPIAYLMLSADMKIHSEPSNPLEILPLGLDMKFTIGFYNNIGQKFDAVSSIAKHRPSRFDLLQISHGYENNSLIVHAFKQGQTVLKVWDVANPRICDYVMIEIGTAIIPAVTDLTLGDVVCFSSRILSDNGFPGFWYTTGHGHVLKMLHDSGIAVARDVGTVTVNYNVSDTLETSLEVVVKPITSVRFVDIPPNFITNDMNAEKHNVSVLLLSDSISKIQDQSCEKFHPSDSLSTHAPFTCDIVFTNAESGVEAREIFTVSAVFNPSSGYYQCQFQTRSLISSGLKHQLSTLVTDIVLTAHISAQGTYQKEIASDPLHISFLPQFVVHTNSVTLSNIQFSSNLVITSSKLLLSSITVSSSHSNVIRVLPAESDAKNPAMLLFAIELVDLELMWETETYKKDYFLKIKSSLNKQKIDIPIKLELYNPFNTDKCLPHMQKNTSWPGLLLAILSNYQNWLTTLLLAIVTSAAIFICYRTVWGQHSNPVIHTNAFLPSSNFTSHGASHSLPASWMGSSPKGSPNSRPYLYSVDRTSPSNMFTSRTPHTSSFEPYDRSREAYS